MTGFYTRLLNWQNPKVRQNNKQVYCSEGQRTRHKKTSTVDVYVKRNVPDNITHRSMWRF